MPILIKVHCKNCKKVFLKDKGHHNENLILGHNFYCSKECEGIHKTRRKKIFCENCGKVIIRIMSAISLHNFCSHSCSMIVNNKRYNRVRLKPKLKTCILCKKPYKKSTGNKRYCSRECRNKGEQYTSEELLQIIKDIYKRINRVPAKRELPKGVNEACRKLFGTWNNAVMAAELNPNRSHNQRMYKRIMAIANDGHSCDSVSEAVIDNWLVKNNIYHERNFSYPNTNHTADWMIPYKNQKIFVEYFGLAKDSPRYDRAIKRKKRICKNNNLKLIAIFPQDIYPKELLEINLKHKFQEFLS